MANKKVAVLLAVHNGKLWLEEQLDSIFSQKNVDVKLIVSDDSSADGSVDAIKSYLNKNSRSADICSAKCGGAAKNFFNLIASADISDCEYIAFADQDDIWLDFKLDRAISCIDKSNFVCYSSSVEAFWPNGKVKILRQSPNLNRYDYLFEGAGQGCTFVMKRDFFLKFKDFLVHNERLAFFLHFHDWAVYGFSRVIGARWFFDPMVTMRYRQHLENDTGAKSSVAGIKSRLIKIYSGWYWNQITCVCKFLSMCPGFDPEGGQLIQILREKKRALGFWKLLFFSRRKITDRLVLAFAFLFGILIHE